MQATVACPYCGEDNTVFIDETAGEEQQYVEDCPVCCKPWQVVISLGRGGGADVEVRAAAE